VIRPPNFEENHKTNKQMTNQ